MGIGSQVCKDRVPVANDLILIVIIEAWSLGWGWVQAQLRVSAIHLRIATLRVYNAICSWLSEFWTNAKEQDIMCLWIVVRSSGSRIFNIIFIMLLSRDDEYLPEYQAVVVARGEGPEMSQVQLLTSPSTSPSPSSSYLWIVEESCLTYERLQSL